MLGKSDWLVSYICFTFKLSFFKKIYFYYVYRCFALCVSLYCVLAWCPQKPEEGVRSPRTGIIDSSALNCWTASSLLLGLFEIYSHCQSWPPAFCAGWLWTSELPASTSLVHYSCVPLCLLLCGARGWTQNLVHAKQVLHELNYTPIPSQQL